MNRKMKFGVVNWDAGLPSDTYFGHFALHTLGHPEHSHRLPYYAKTDENGNYFIPFRSQSDYDAELLLAADAGIDFFMYCWYPNSVSQENEHEEIDRYLPELNRMRKLYQMSPLNKRIKMCAILIALHTYTDADLLDLIHTMQEDYYEKKDGRPLVFIFGGYHPDLIGRVRQTADSVGIEPFVVFLNNGKSSETGDYSAADAVSAYASGHGAETFEEFTKAVETDNERRKQYSLPVIPLISAGWNPQPRIDRPCPWVRYPVCTYAPAPTAAQMEAAVYSCLQWIDNNRDCANTGYGVVFAWNEFEEGGYLCPTLGADGTPKTEILDGFRRAIHNL